jgi:hypothetical protein
MVDSDGPLRRIKLNGARFDGGRLPVDSLVELERYQQLLRIIARAEWQAQHSGIAVPAGFDDELSLTIERIEPGSADVFLAFEQRQVSEAHQAQAQDALDLVIAAAYSGAELPPLPETIEQDVRDRIVQFGNTLEEHQSISIYLGDPDADHAPVSIDRETRKQVIDRFALEDYLALPTDVPAPGLNKQVESVIGRITEVDAEKATFRFESLRYGKLIGHYKLESEMIRNIRAVIDSAAEAPVLRIEGELQYRNGIPWRFTTTELIEEFAAGTEAWAARLIDLAQLQAGWGEDGSGKVIAFTALDAANKIMNSLAKASRYLPAMFATEEGGVVLEWASGTLVRSIETTPDAVFELFVKSAGSPGSLKMTSNLGEALDFASDIEA